jgi:outer membrane protein
VSSNEDTVKHSLPAALLLLVLLPGLAPAADLASPSFPPTPSSDWIVTLSGKLTASPDYPGSKNTGFLPYPSLSLHDANAPASFSAPDDDISLALFDSGWLKAGPALKFISVRSPSDDHELRGFNDVPWSLEAGGFVEFYPLKQLRTRVEIREGFHGYSGIRADLGADWIQPWRNWQFSVGPRLALAGDGFMNKYFSVSDSEAFANGFVSPFKAHGGLESVGVTGAATYRWSPEWATTGWLRYDHLTDDAALSPITRKLGTPNQISFGLTVSYSFVTKKWF